MNCDVDVNFDVKTDLVFLTCLSMVCRLLICTDSTLIILPFPLVVGLNLGCFDVLMM